MAGSGSGGRVVLQKNDIAIKKALYKSGMAV
jgi:hypothetical protein